MRETKLKISSLLIVRIAEVDALVRMLYNIDDLGEELQGILDKMDSDGDGEVSLDELINYNHKFPDLLKPAFRAQEKMQKKVIGKGCESMHQLSRKPPSHVAILTCNIF